MAPKGGKKDDADLAQQDVLQGVVLADSFTSFFRPETYSKPKVLLPLANLPMIEYTLEFLAAGGVQEIFIVCCAHAAAVQRYVEETKLQRRLATVRLHVIISQNTCTSAGDALREVEARGVIKSDFVLVPGDVVANVALGPLVAAHKARREVDREAVLTTLMARVPTSHRARRAGEAKLVALSGETGRLLLYDEVARRDWEHKVRLPITLLQESDHLSLHADLYDTHIDICTPELLVLLQDNFDWQDLRRDMIPGILGQYEYLGKTMYTHVLSNEYAARVHDPHTYDVVTRDLIQRWAYPLVPDANLLPECTYRYGSHYVYKETGVTMARSSTLTRDCVVGAGTTIGERTTVEASTLGRGCTVGAGVTIQGSYLWENVVIEAGASLNGCICCEGVVVGRNAIVPPGCVLGAGVRVGAGCSLPRYARFQAPREEGVDDDDDDDDDEDEDEEGDEEDGPMDAERSARRATAAATAEAIKKADLLGPGGVGQLWKVMPTATSMGFERAKIEGPVEGEESEEEEEDMEEGDADEVLEDEDASFFDEVDDNVQTAVADPKGSVDNLSLEIKGLKFANDRTFADCIRGIVPSLLTEEGLGERPKKEKVTWIKARLKKWSGIFDKFVQGKAERTALLEALVDTYGTKEGLIDIFEHTLNWLYEKTNLLPEAIILKWAEEAERQADDTPGKRCVTSAKAMIEWLRDEDDDEDDDE